MHRVLAAAVAAVAVTLAGAAGADDAASATKTSPSQLTSSQASPVRTGSVSRFNVSATHSPELEQLLAGHATTAPASTRTRAASLPAVASTVQGVDVSSHQHTAGASINWAYLATTAGYKFAFIKAAEGSYYANPYYASDAAGAQSASMLVAPYEFAIPNYSGGALQADFLLDHANYAPDGQMLPPILDIEYDLYAGKDGTPAKSWCYGLTPAQMVAWIAAFTTEIHRRTGQPPVIYTTAEWWNKCTGGSAKFRSDPLWIAAPPGPTAPTLPAGWSNFAYWQYTSTETSPAISGAFDVSYLSSTALELAAPAIPSDQAGQQASLQLNALNGGPTASYAATGLPGGTTISSTGDIGGTLPASAASFPAVVTATAGTVSASQSFTWDVHSGVGLGSLTSQRGPVAVPVRYQVQATDGLPGCTLRFSATGLPPGLAMSSCGLITGWPLTSGSYTVGVQVSDSSDAVLARGSFGWRVTLGSGSGPAGHLSIARDGKCLAERTATDIAIETCSPAVAERWTIAADGTVRVRGECLAARSPSSTAPAALYLMSCSNGGQRWQLGSNAVLKNLATGRCLADTGTRNGTRAVAARCKATSNSTGSASTPTSTQQWTLPAGPLASGVAGECASSLRGASQATGTVTLRACKKSGQQDWIAEPDGAISLGGKCLGTAGAHLAPGTQLRLVTCVRRAADQVWQLAGGPVGVQLVNPAAGLCVADPSDLRRAGTTLVIGPCVASDFGTTWRVS